MKSQRTTSNLGITRSLKGFLTLGIFILGCSVNTTKSHYILAEKFWNEGNYAAAVSEFEKVTAREPRGKLGLQALYRAAITQTLFLSRHADAAQKFKTFAALTAEPGAAWEALKQVGEIFFAKTEQYDQAIQHYRGLIKLRPNSPEEPEFLFRIGRSLFFLWQFDEAIQIYEEIASKFLNTPWGEKALYEIGVTQFTRGEQMTEGRSGERRDSKGSPYQGAIRAFQRFMLAYPQSKMIPEAKFGIASCQEEMDQLDQAYQSYQEIERTYPSPNVVKIKMIRIRERKAQRSH